MFLMEMVEMKKVEMFPWKFPGNAFPHSFPISGNFLEISKEIFPVSIEFLRKWLEMGNDWIY